MLLLQQHWLSNEQVRLRFQQVGPMSKQGAEPPEPPLTLITGFTYGNGPPTVTGSYL